MLNINIVQGNLVADPELKKVGPNGDISAVSFTVACTRDYAPKGKEKETDFIDCQAWRHTAEFIAKYFKKGQQILVQGSTQTRTGEKDGVKRKYTTLNVESANFCGYNKGDSAGGGSASAPAASAAPAATGGASVEDDYVIDDDTQDLPF